MSIDILRESDWDQWHELWRRYLDFYNTTLPEEQYKSTFSRILDPAGDIHALVIREEDGMLNGLAHYLFHTSAWSDQPVCYLNDLFVNPDIRGKGYGKKLIVACGKAAEVKGCYKYYWITQHENTTARRLYDTFGKSGFAEYRIKLPSEMLK